MAENDKRRRSRRRRRKRSPLFAPLSFIVICAAMVFGMGVFFRVSSIEVTGGSIYSDEEIIEASGVEEGDNLFFLNRFSAISRIRAKLIYIEEAQVSRSLPNKVSIEVIESRALAYISMDREYWGINRGCKLMDTVGYDETRGLIEILGLTPIAPELRAIIAPGEEEAIKVSYLSDILREIQERGLAGEVSSVDMSNAANPSFQLMGRFTVKLGKNENTGHKFERMQGAIEQLSDNEAGTIDLTQSEKTVFSPG